MIQYLSEKTAKWLAEGDDPADIEVIAYGYYMFYQQWLVTIGILLIALPFGLFPLVLTSLVTFMVLRGYIAGTHATHPLICKAFTFGLAFTPAVLATFFAVRLPLPAVLALYLLSIAILVKYAPGDTDVKKIHNPQIRKQMKMKSVVCTSMFFLAAALLHGRFPMFSFVIATTAFIASSMVHPVMYWLFGFDPVTKEARKPRW